MELTSVSNVRQIALAAVASNLLLFALLAAVLPHVLLPIAALMLPLLTAAWVDAALQRKPQPRQRKPQPRSRPARMQRALPHAA